MQAAGVFDGDFDHVELCGALRSLSCRVEAICPQSPAVASGEPPLPLRKDRSFLNFIGMQREFAAENLRKIRIVQNDHVGIVCFSVVVLPSFIPPTETDDIRPSI